MINSYKNKEKPSFFKRMVDGLFHKTKLLEAPLEYNQKAVRKKSYDIINYLKYRERI